MKSKKNSQILSKNAYQLTMLLIYFISSCTVLAGNNAEKAFSAKLSFWVAENGSNQNPGTKDSPFATPAKGTGRGKGIH